MGVSASRGLSGLKDCPGTDGVSLSGGQTAESTNSPSKGPGGTALLTLAQGGRVLGHLDTPGLGLSRGWQPHLSLPEGSWVFRGPRTRISWEEGPSPAREVAVQTGRWMWAQEVGPPQTCRFTHVSQTDLLFVEHKTHT